MTTKIRLNSQVQWILPDENSPNLLIKSPVYTESETASKWWVFNWDFENGTGTTSTSTWIGAESYWWGNNNIIDWSHTAVSFDNTVAFSWKQSLKITCTNVADYTTQHLYTNWSYPDLSFLSNREWIIKKYFIPIKSSTKYRLSFSLKTSAIVSASNWITFWYNLFTDTTLIWGTNIISNLTWTQDWTKYSSEFTTWSTAKYLNINNTLAYSTGTAWIDNISLEEIIETTNDNLTQKEQGIIGFTAQGLSNSIDQSQLLTNSVPSFWWDWTSQNLWKKIAQSFTPTKTKLSWIILKAWPNIWKPTEWVLVTIQTDNAGSPSGTILASKTLTSEQYPIADWTQITFDVPCILTAWTTYWIVIDRASGSYQNTNLYRLYWYESSVYSWWVAKYMNNSNAWLNWTSWDLYFKTLYYTPTNWFHATLNNTELKINADEDWFLEGAKIDLVNGKYTYKGIATNDAELLARANDIHQASAWWASSWQLVINWFSFQPWVWEYQAISDATTRYLSWKVNTKFPVKHLSISSSIYSAWDDIMFLQVSSDNVNWTTIWSVKTTESRTIRKIETDLMNWLSTFYVRWYKTASDYLSASWINIDASIDTSSLPIAYNFPTNKDISQTYTKLLQTATTTATYRATKYWFPAIEYAEWVYQYLQVDTSNATYVKFSSDWTTYATKADWESLTISSTLLPIIYTIVKIPANRLYFSSDDTSSSAIKEWSLTWGITTINKTQWLVYDVDDLKNEIKILKDAIYLLQNPLT